jgi:crotonobetainyl-CoA:carnitine CoA-transferase CaiB-like acyl-CoA transferase
MTELPGLLELLELSGETDVSINGEEGIVSSHFRVSEAAASALAACGVGANTIWRSRGGKNQTISVNREGAGVSLLSFLCQRLDDDSQPERDPNRALVGFYPTKDDRWVHLHGAFPRLAEGTLNILKCSNDHDSVASAVKKWNAQALEDELAAAGMCGAMARSRTEWLAHPQGIALKDEPPIVIEKIGDSEPINFSSATRPLSDVKVLDLTRVLAGPTCARTLASHGANVLKVNSPKLPSVPPFVIDTGHGKRSTFLDLTQPDDRDTLKQLAASADVFSQGYRKDALDRLGFGPGHLAELRPGIIYVSINAYGHIGPWVGRPGWEQLAQTASGIACDEGTKAQPKLISAAATDYTTGYLAAAGVITALARRALSGGSYHVKVSLTQTANWLYALKPAAHTTAFRPMDPEIVANYMTQSESGFGILHHLGPILEMSETPPRWEQVTVPLGSHKASW